MAVRPVARVLLPAAVLLHLWSQATAAPWVRISVDISNLSYAAIEPAKQAGLARGYAVDIAAAISLPVADLLSLDGVAASVTIAQAPSLQPGSGAHADVRPITSTDTTSTAVSATTSAAAGATTAVATSAATTATSAASTATTTIATTPASSTSSSSTTTVVTTAASTSAAGSAATTTAASSSSSAAVTTGTSTSSRASAATTTAAATTATLTTSSATTATHTTSRGAVAATTATTTSSASSTSTTMQATSTSSGVVAATTATSTSSGTAAAATVSSTTTTAEATTAVSTSTAASPTSTANPATSTQSSVGEEDGDDSSNSSGLPPPVRPMRGVAYGALPCKGQSCFERGLPPQDMLQEGYAQQWGTAGRDDLGVMHALGGNAVRLYHSFGLNTESNHSGFLDRAHEVGVHVLPGFHTELALRCPEFDCYEHWKEATLKGFALGYKAEGGWHPAVSMVILLNEPDFFEFGPECAAGGNPGAWCRVRASLSALDGLLAAEREAGVPGSVNLTIAWSFGMMWSIDEQIMGPGYFGFQDMKVAVRDPSLAGYTPRTPQADFEEAYRTRWVNCLNTQAPWDYVDQVITSNYGPFEPTPWFIGEYGANGQPRDVIERDLQGMDLTARQGSNFLGVVFFQFQTANQKGGSELNFGMFDLGTEEIAQTGEVWDDGGLRMRWPVRCLDAELAFLPGTLAERAEAVATAWEGALQHPSFCDKRRRLADTAPVASISCHARTEAGAALDKDALREQLVRRTLFELGAGSAAVVGQLSVGGITLDESRQPVAAAPAEAPAKRGLSWWGWLVLACAAVLLAAGSATVACCVARGKAARAQEATRALPAAQV